MEQRYRKAALTACSNGQCENEQKKYIEQTCEVLKGFGIEPVLSPVLYADATGLNGSGKQRAEVLMKFYEDVQIDVIFDVSGGDAANMVLSYLDYDVIRRNPKPFVGYSDLTTILNAIYCKTNNVGVLYQIKNLVWDVSGVSKQRFAQSLKRNALGDDTIAYRFLQGTQMQGVLVGGNIRCLLKLAGTEYWPDMEGKLLLLESLGGDVAQIGTYFAQLTQLGVWEQIAGVVLGTFTQMEQQNRTPDAGQMLLTLLHEQRNPRVADLAVIKTDEIGHANDSKMLCIGKNYHF